MTKTRTRKAGHLALILAAACLLMALAGCTGCGATPENTESTEPAEAAEYAENTGATGEAATETKAVSYSRPWEGYTGYMDELECSTGECYQGLDIDGDGLTDRVYRTQLEAEDECSYELHFGNGRRLGVGTHGGNYMPRFKMVCDGSYIICSAYMYGACGTVPISIQIYEDDGDGYSEMKLPFSGYGGTDDRYDPYCRWVNINIEFPETESRSLIYTCEEVPGFSCEVRDADEEKYAYIRQKLGTDSGNILKCRDRIIYNIQESPLAGEIICHAEPIHMSGYVLEFHLRCSGGEWYIHKCTVAMAQAIAYEDF